MGNLRSTTAKLVPTKYIISKENKFRQIEYLHKYIVNVESILTVRDDAPTIGILTPCIDVFKNGHQDGFGLNTGFQKKSFGGYRKPSA